MTNHPLRFVFFGLSITSSWGNGHATTYRALVRELSLRGHQVLFFERDVPWYAANRDMPEPPYGKTVLYSSLQELKRHFTGDIREADVVIVGSYVPEGIALGQWVMQTARGVKAFYDIDTPVTLAGLAQGAVEYISADLIPRYDLYLSFTGGPTLECLEKKLGSPAARALYCSVDPSVYYPQPMSQAWDLGYLGTYSDDRQPKLEAHLMRLAETWVEGRFVVAGPKYPRELSWPLNVARIEHLAAERHREFYNMQRFTLNVTRAAMVDAGFSPSVRLFEAAACGTPIISDAWAGLETLFKPGYEILVPRSPSDTLAYLREMPEGERQKIARRARRRVLSAHTAAHRAMELEDYVLAFMRGNTMTAVIDRVS